MKAQQNTIEFAAFEPDKPHYGGSIVQEAKNVIPVSKGYRYLPQMADMGFPALSGRILSALSVKGLDGSIHTLASNATGIYALEGGEWVSKYTGSAVNSNRKFVQYGNTVYALFGRTLLKSTLTATFSTFTAVSDAPNGDVLGVINDFLFIGRDTVGNKIHWSAIDNPDDFPTVGTDEAQNKMSDVQVFATGGQIQAFVGGVGGVDGLIFCESAVYRASFVGTPLIYEFKPVDRKCGAVSGSSVVTVDTKCFYLSQDGWKVTDGSAVKNIGVERIDKWFADNSDPHRLSEVQGATDPIHNVIVWTFASKPCPETYHDRVLIYNYIVDKWAYGTINTEYIFEDYMRGKTLEDLDSYGNLDNLPFSSLDSNALREEGLLLSGFTPNHKFVSFSGQAMEGIIDTAEYGGSRMIVHGVRPLVDRANAQASLMYRDRQELQPTIGAYNMQSRDGVCYLHTSTRYASARVKIPSGNAWNNALGCELFFEIEGGW